MLEQTSEMTTLLFRLLNSDLNQALWDEHMLHHLINPIDITPQTEYELAQFMNTISSKNDLILSMWVYSINTQSILCSDGKEYSLEDYPNADLIRNHTPSPNFSFPNDDNLFPEIISEDHRLFLVQDLVLAQPIGSVYIELNLESLYQNLGLDNLELSSGFYDENGLQIPSTLVSSHLPESIPLSRLNEKGKISLDGSLWTYVYIPEIHWYYIQEYTTEFSIALHTLLPGLIPGILLFIIIGLLAAYQITGKIYAPINRLVHLVLEKNGDSVPNQQNEFDYLQLSFFQTIDESQQLQVSMERFEKEILVQIFRSVMEGMSLDDAGWDNIGADLRESWMNCRQYLVVVCHRKCSDDLGILGHADSRLFLKGLENQIQKNFRVSSWLVVPMTANTTAIVLGDDISSVSNFCRNVSLMQNKLQESFQDSAFPIQLVHGRSFTHLEDILLSWQEGVQKLRYTTYIENSSILLEDNTPSNAAYFRERAAQIVNYVLAGKQTLAAELLPQTLDELFTTVSSVEDKKCCFDSMKEAFLEKLLTISSQDEQLHYSLTSQDFYELTDTDLKEKMLIIFRDQMNLLTQSTKKKSYRYMEDALRYIQENANDSDLSASMVAEHLRISTGYFSEFFNENMQESFTSYLNRLRIENAKKILAQTSLPIRDVGFKCGFCTVQHFNRTFKKLTSQTPKQYRDMTATEYETRGESQ
ncbi:MAG: AraC family transcriptional regulator [Clostridiales bacterium]|nr:AraC family transcriptional regulator [Clostridiales bacterium]